MASQRLSSTILLVAISLAVASALQTSAVVFSANTNIPVFDGHTVRPHVRTSSTEIHGSRVQSLSSPTSLSRVRRQEQSPTSTQLQYSDDSNPTTPLEGSWWRKIISRSYTPTGSSEDENEEQENVDAYLEFLDRRYRRLHSDDKDEKKAKSTPTESKGFSAMEWLTKGGSGSSPSIETTRQQQQDALYVLGVAGLASQKLLQKHHLPANNSQQSKQASATIDKVVELKEQIDDAIEVGDGNVNVSLKSKANSMILNRILLPVIRTLYLLQRMKHVLFELIKNQLNIFATKAMNAIVTTMSQGPVSILSRVLGVGGGRQNILRTIAIGYGTILFFRPLLHATFTEGIAFDQLIQ